MDLETLKAMATPGSYIDRFIQGLEGRLPTLGMGLQPYQASATELRAVAMFLYETFGFDLLIYDWYLHMDYTGRYILDYLPLTQTDCCKLVALGVDTGECQILRKAYPNGSLPLGAYLMLSINYQAHCLEDYPISDEILNYEMTHLEGTINDVDDVYNLRRWLQSLRKALRKKKRYRDAKRVNTLYDQLAKREGWN
jgi:hypothetical protein